MNWSKYTSLISEEMIYQKHLQQKKMGHSVTTTAEKLHFQSQSRWEGKSHFDTESLNCKLQALINKMIGFSQNSF